MQKVKTVQLSISKSVEGIIRSQNKKKPRRNVNFNKQLFEVIGYGGEDWSEGEEEEEEEVYEESQDDSELDEEDDKELIRLTKANTDFNTNSLNDAIETKKSYAQLMLGKPQMDSEGRKQTLLVSVTPFGQDNKKSKPMSHIPIAKNKDNYDNKNVVLTSYSKNDEKIENEEKSLLDEISETLENSVNPIQIISRKKIQKEIVLSIPDVANKENIEEKLNKSVIEEKKKSSIPERKNGLTRNPVIKRDDKPVIYQTAITKIELMNTKNTKITNESLKKEEIKCETESVTDDSSITSSGEESAKDDSDSGSDLKYQNVTFSQSRELAGEPDGRADPDASEPPALPRTPPPNVDPLPEKPKIPSKPSTIMIRKPPIITHQIETQNVMTTFSVEAKTEEKTKLTKQDSNGSDVCKISNKRKAPKPPSEEIMQIYTRNPAPNSDSPVVREKEKRERASIGPKLVSSMSNYSQNELIVESSIPEPAPRRSLSLSTDSLASNDERKKEKARGRFSLKKFLRMGSNKDLHKLPLDARSAEDDLKPRLVIVHPLDLNSGKVEVLKEQDYATPQYTSYRGAKPPPPPRTYDEVKPSLPHPPKSAEILNKHKNLQNQRALAKKTDTVYANIGEVRSAITPNKPQRTASMREREAQQQQTKPQPHNYEPIDLRNKDTSSTENVYDYINGRSSSPEYESCKSPVLKPVRSESNVDVSSDYYKYSNIPRTMSLTYCGSETESEIYSPYSYYGSESEIAEDDHDWNSTGGRTHKLRSRKGRSIVHKNLEDNYGAVVIANHEALAQVLENIQQTPTILPALRGLKSAANLRWSDFTIKATLAPLMVGSRAFHQAMWGSQHVTLVISSGSVPTSPLSLGTFSLLPITEFSDLIPIKYLPTKATQDIKHLQATVAVLPCMQVNTIQTFSEMLKLKSNGEEVWKDVCFVLLQLVNALKTLQAQGIEELPLSLTSFVLCKEMDKEAHNRLFVLQGLGEDMSSKKEEEKFGTLCMCVLTALDHLNPNAKLAPLLHSLLNTERAIALTQVKSILEFSLWGPSDVALGSTVRERESALQRWLDLQRATVLHGLVCAKVHLTVYEECHLLFLVRSNARMMCDASMLLESTKQKLAH